jgi:hypothetical protein
VSPLIFDPQDPYPLESMSYPEAQRHAGAVDLWLGLRIDEVEADISFKNQSSGPRDQQKWGGLAPQVLLTPYTELRAMLADVGLKNSDCVVDLGAGYGRMGFVLAKHYPEVQFVGYEILEERVREAKRCLENHSCHRAKMICADLSATDFFPVLANVYFIYDYGSRLAVVKTLEDLKKIAQTRPITVIGRGRLSRDLIERETPWLSQVIKPSHRGNFSIYRS